MKPRPHGNGSGKIDIHQQDMGGWVRVFTDDAHLQHEELATYLSLGLTEWFRQRPYLRMRCMTTVVKDGRTSELHCWYDTHVFTDLTLQTPIQK